MGIPTITINQDEKCKQCGKPGACKRPDGEYGICLECVNKNFERIKSMEMKKTHEMVDAEVRNLVETEWHKIVSAYRNSCYEVGVSIKVNLAGNAEVVEIVTGIEYYPLPKTKVKNDPVTVDEKQMELPFSANSDPSHAESEE